MTRIVNATIFRLGYSKKWSSAWMNSTSSFYRKFLHEDYVIYRFVTIFFTKYTMEPFGHGIPRVFPGKASKSKKASGLEVIINNPLIQSNFSFSHVSLGRSASLDISCFFLDSSLEVWRTGKYKMRNHRSHNIFFPKMFRHSFFSESKVFSKLLRLRHRKFGKTFSFFIRLLRLRKNYRSVMLQKMKEKSKKIRKIKDVKRIKRFFKGFSYCKRLFNLSAMYSERKKQNGKDIKYLQLYPSFLYNNLKASVSFHIPVYKEKKNFKLLKILFLLFSQNLSYNIKKQFFFTVLLKTIMLSLAENRFFYFRTPRSAPFLKFISLLRIKEYSFQHLNFFFFRTVIKNRFFIFNCASFAISQSLKAFDKNEKINLSYYGLHIRNITAAYVLNFILFQLRSFFTIQEIFRTLLKDLKRNSNLKGYRIVVAGRLTRAERAAYIIKQTTKIPLGTKVVFIDYAADFVILRFGLVGVKVWLNYDKFRPFFYKFSFFIKNVEAGTRFLEAGGRPRLKEINTKKKIIYSKKKNDAFIKNDDGGRPQKSFIIC